jgi:hypothetical protein
MRKGRMEIIKERVSDNKNERTCSTFLLQDGQNECPDKIDEVLIDSEELVPLQFTINRFYEYHFIAIIIVNALISFKALMINLFFRNMNFIWVVFAPVNKWVYPLLKRRTKIRTPKTP